MTVLYYAQEGASQAEEKALSETAQGFFLCCRDRTIRVNLHRLKGMMQEA